MLPLWTDASKSRVVCFIVGLGCGGTLLLLPPKVDVREVTTTRFVTKEVVEKKDVVRWKDRKVIIEKPGQTVTIVEKSGQEDKSQSKSKESETTKTSDVTSYKARYTLGMFMLYPGKISLEAGIQLGNLPVFLTGSVGQVDLQGGISPLFGLGIRYEF